MGCCGSKRAALISKTTYARMQKSLYAPARAAPVVQPQPETKSILLSYLGHGSISLQGPATGQVYFFPEEDPVAFVHEKDRDALLRTRLFKVVENSKIQAGKAT
jgi:hypothetical protein